MAGPVHANVVAAAGLTGYLDQAAPRVRFTFVETYFNVPSVSGSDGCDNSVAGYGVIQVVGIDGPGTPDSEEAGVAETGCNGVTTADFMYNVAGYGAFYYSGVNPGDAVEAFHHREQGQRVRATGERPVNRRAPEGDNGLPGEQLPGQHGGGVQPGGQSWWSGRA